MLYPSILSSYLTDFVSVLAKVENLSYDCPPTSKLRGNANRVHTVLYSHNARVSHSYSDGGKIG